MYTIDLSGKQAVIAGVANHRSLAWAIAQHLGRAGATLHLTYQTERIRPTVAKLAATFPGTELYECDVSSEESIGSAFEAIDRKVDSIDLLVHAIAYAPKEELEGPFLETTREGFRVALDVSTYSLLALARHAVPRMRHGGNILSLTYIASQRAIPHYNVMGTAKAGLEQITRQLAFELGTEGIRVNAISAGPINTLSARGISGFNSILKHYRQEAPMRRGIEPDEVGAAGLFLCSDLASGITGDVLYVDAGYHTVL